MSIPNQGKTALLNILRNPSGYAVIPYTNDITPDADTVYADMVQAPMQNVGSFGVNWQAVVIDGSDNATITSDPITFVNWTGPFPFTIYGFFLHYLGLYLLKVVPFDSPIEITEAGQQITRDVTITIPD